MSIAVGFALFALRQNINLYYTPKDLLTHQQAIGKSFRLGGLVLKRSVKRHQLNTQFIVTDYHHKIIVRYHGMLPSLFREGQGVVIEGRLNSKGIFIADQVLAKHDANYHPPEQR